MVSSGMLRRGALVRTYVLEELSASFIRVTTSNRRTLRRNTLMNKALCSSETSVLTRAKRRNIPEDTIHEDVWFPFPLFLVPNKTEQDCHLYAWQGTAAPPAVANGPVTP
jgi:hypothetical protein